ncbi:MAG TPA: class I SAM-dependent methyltransferase [Polyangiaceae bacterium]|nr:class I SAM-dependent methyltransferase [Polyangiaceae bacterium]HMR77478.1 class I SAM-dependent methyltransferase [Polyangiaceae bacterium]
MSPAALHSLSPEQLEEIRTVTVAHYHRAARDFWEGTKDHDVRQNVDALLRHVRASAPFDILDVGCGPGRDLMTFRDLGHRPVGLDACAAFVAMARANSDCEVWQQDLLALDLPDARFDGVFANAVLFHVPSQELPRVLEQLHRALKPDGALFCSNPRGPDSEHWNGDRYGCYLSLATWRDYATQAGFEELEHFYRPEGRPQAEQPWLASVWRKPA